MSSPINMFFGMKQKGNPRSPRRMLPSPPPPLSLQPPKMQNSMWKGLVVHVVVPTDLGNTSFTAGHSRSLDNCIIRHYVCVDFRIAGACHHGHQLADWLENRGLLLNERKSQVLSICGRDAQTSIAVNCHQTRLPACTAAKYLGLTITEQLTWDDHIHDVTAKVNRKVGAFMASLAIPFPEGQGPIPKIRCDARPIIWKCGL